jgi:membrane protease YdiL (CAAX protease family)
METKEMDTIQTTKTRPMPFWMSLIFFGVPAAIIGTGFYLGIPLLARIGIPFFWSYNFFMGFPAIMMFVAVFIACRLEGNPFTWEGIRSRLRLKPIKGKEWLWTAGLFLVFGAGPFVLGFANRWLASTHLFTPPDFLPALLDPRANIASGLGNDFWGVPLRGNWWVFGVELIVIFFNIFGEELWWRGYVLPRQELAQGKRAWVVHGILWLLFHVHQRWNWIGMLPGALMTPFVASKLKNTSPAIIAHWANNGLLLVVIILGILGVTS